MVSTVISVCVNARAQSSKNIHVHVDRVAEMHMKKNPFHSHFTYIHTRTSIEGAVGGYGAALAKNELHIYSLQFFFLYILPPILKPINYYPELFTNPTLVITPMPSCPVYCSANIVIPPEACCMCGTTT